MSRSPWSGSWDTPARREVDGGVVVAKPGKVTHALAIELLEQADIEAETRILARGRTYARAGQVVAVESSDEAFTANIQGSSARPYKVALRRVGISGHARVDASCNCPYSCDFGWCKHAAALAYVAAFLLDGDATVRARWSGEPDQLAPGPDGVSPDAFPEAALTVSADVLATLRTAPIAVDIQQMIDRATAIVPAPELAIDRS